MFACSQRMQRIELRYVFFSMDKVARNGYSYSHLSTLERKKMIDTPTEEPTKIITLVPPTLPAQRPFFSGRMPIPPSVNMAYQVIRDRDSHERVRGMRIGPTPALVQFKYDAALMLTQAFADWSLINAIRESKRKVPLAVKIDVYFSTEWKRDLDGILKYAIDAAFDRMQLNDNQVVSVQAEKLVDQIEPRVEIEISVVVR